MKPFRRRDIAQIVIPLPTNLAAVKRALMELPGINVCPDHRIKITYDAMAESALISVPVHWSEEDAHAMVNESR